MKKNQMKIKNLKKENLKNISYFCLKHKKNNKFKFLIKLCD